MTNKEDWYFDGQRNFTSNGYIITAIPVMSKEGPKRLYRALSKERHLGIHQTGEEARKACLSDYTHSRKKALTN